MSKQETVSETIKRLSKRFPFIVIHGHDMGSNRYYIAEELLKAEEENAPFDSTAHIGGYDKGGQPNTGWYLFRDYNINEREEWIINQYKKAMKMAMG